MILLLFLFAFLFFADTDGWGTGGLMILTDTPGLRVATQAWDHLTLEAFPALSPAALSALTNASGHHGSCTPGVHTVERALYDECARGDTARVDHVRMTTSMTSANREDRATFQIGIEIIPDAAGIPYQKITSHPHAPPPTHAVDTPTHSVNTRPRGERAWSVRVHLRPGQRVCRGVSNGTPLDIAIEESSRVPRNSTDVAVLYHIAPKAPAEGWKHFPLGGVSDPSPAPLAGNVVMVHLPSVSHASMVTQKVDLTVC